jgi:hypothetical protein
VAARQWDQNATVDRVIELITSSVWP